LSDRIYWEFLLFSCCFSPYFLHKKAGWGRRLTPASLFKFSRPGIRIPHPAKKKPSGQKNLNPVS
ncbi:hypothetical protein ACVGV8_06845, partial [Enterobacter intestinihominis]